MTRALILSVACHAMLLMGAIALSNSEKHHDLAVQIGQIRFNSKREAEQESHHRNRFHGNPAKTKKGILPAVPTEGASSSKSISNEDYYLTELIAINRPPEYPALARLRHEEGTVRIQVTVAAHLITASIVQSSHSNLLDQVALRTVKSWKFPKQEENRGEFIVVIPFHFGIR